MKYGLLIFLTSILLVSCAEKSNIDPLYQAKSFYEATNGKPIKLIIPLTNKTMDRIDSVTSTEGYELSKAKWYERVWEGAKGFVFNIGAKLGLAKLRISIEHSLMSIDKNGNESGLTPELIRDTVKSVKISKVFFTFKSPCESRPNDQECRDWSGVFNNKNKQASFDSIKKVFVNMSLKDRKEKISDEVSISDSIAEIYKEKNTKLLFPQLDLKDSNKLASVLYPQDFNLGYYADNNKKLEKEYILKSSKHNSKNVYVIESNKPSVLRNRLFKFLSIEFDITEENIEYILKNEILMTESSLLVDLNNLKMFRSALKEFSRTEGVNFSVCEKTRCLSPLRSDREIRDNTQYSFKTEESIEDNIIIVINNDRKGIARKFKKGFIHNLSLKLDIEESLLNDVLDNEVVAYENATLIDFNRFPEFKNEFLNKYRHKRIVSCAKNQCLPLLNEEIKEQLDNTTHLNLPKDKLDLIFVINVKEEEKVEIKNKILQAVALDHGIDPRKLEAEMIGNIVPLHDQIIFNFNDFENYSLSFLKAIKNEQLKISTCNVQNCLFLGTNKMNLKPLLSKSTSGGIDIYLDIKKVPEVALYLKGYLELEIVLDL